MKIVWKDKFKEKDKIIYWIRNWFDNEGEMGENSDTVVASKVIPSIDNPIPKRAIVNITGGKDSAITAALCVEALGKNRVMGVIVSEPTWRQSEIQDAKKVIELLGIEKYMFDISNVMGTFKDAFMRGLGNKVALPISETYKTIPYRIANVIQYTLAGQMINGNVVCSQNASELYIGSNVKYGDLAGDMAPLADIPATLVTDIGRAIAYTIPELLPIIEKKPAYEDTLGFSYEDLDNYLFNGEFNNQDVVNMIEFMHKISASKSCINIPRYRALIQDDVDEEAGIIYAET